jgi:hypothetical protein
MLLNNYKREGERGNRNLHQVLASWQPVNEILHEINSGINLITDSELM